MATMAVAMATARAKPSMRGVLEMLITSNNISRRHMHAPSKLCVPENRAFNASWSHI